MSELARYGMPEERWRRIFSIRLKQKMDEFEISYIALAELVGVHRSTIYRWTNCEITPDAYVIVRLSRIFCCSVDELCT